MKSGKSFFKKISEKLGMFANIKAAIKNAEADTIWFFNVEYYLMLYLFLHKKPKQRIVCTFFLDGYHNGLVGKIKQFIFERAQKKIDHIIATGPSIAFKNCDYTYIPDYYYEPGKYDSFHDANKEDMAVCLGTMHDGKLLEDMVEAFSKNGYPLKVAGRFYNKERYENLKSMAAENVTIEDKCLDDSEYLELLSKAKYTVLPYDKSQYNTQTSGVMQEAVFVGTVVVSFNEILKGNAVDGVGFESFDKG